MVALTIVVIILLAAAWLAIYTQIGVIPKDAWGRLWERHFGQEPPFEKFTRRFKEDLDAVHKERSDLEEEEIFHDVFDAMDKMNISEVESFKAYGHRTFYFTCRQCKQKNRLGTDLRKFKNAGCGKCHAKFAGGPTEATGPQTTAGGSGPSKYN